MTDLPRHELERLVRALADTAIVDKNPDIWQSISRGGDWDLLVPSPRAAVGVAVSLLGAGRIIQRSYVTTVVWEWGRLDFLPDLRWRGVVLLSYDEVFEGSARGSHGLMVARPAHQVIAACVYPLLAVGRWKPRYDELWRTAWRADGDELQRVLGRTFGECAGDPQSVRAMPKRLLRRRAIHRSLRRDLSGHASRTAAFWCAEPIARARERGVL